MYDIGQTFLNIAPQVNSVSHYCLTYTRTSNIGRTTFAVLLIICFAAVGLVGQTQNPDDFTIIVLPDTQFYYSAYGNVIAGSGSATFFQLQTQWIAANKTALNIQSVLGVGDIVNQPDPKLSPNQWPEANSAVATLDTAGIPYVFPVGNHDYMPVDNVAGRTAALTNFNSYFGPARYASYGWYRGQFPAGSNENFYAIVNIRGKDYLLLALEMYPRDTSLDWARQVLQKNSGAEVIITTHAMEYWDNHRVGVCDNISLPSYGLKYDNEGDRMWYSFIREFSNISLVLNGHFVDMPSGTPTGEAVGHSADVGLKGNLVNQIMADYQDITNGGDGYLRVLTFSPSQNTIAVRTYSPYLNNYLTDAQNQFTATWHGPVNLPSGTTTVSGVLTDDSCHPFTSAAVTVNGVTSTNTDTAGHFSVAVSAPGIYTIRSFVSSIGGTQQVIAAAAGYPTYMKMFITGGSASVSGTVTSGGTPVEGAIVSFSLGSAVTNAAGSYQVPYVPGGDFIFSVTAPRFSVASQTVHVVSGSSLSGINFEVVPLTTATGAITGSVSGPFGTIGGATVSYNGGSTTTDVAGSYTLSNLSTGTITVMASASGYESSSQAVSVTGGATAIANFILVSTGTIAGTVKNSTGTAISGAAVSYSGGSTTTDVSGNYTLSKVPAGTITVVASANGYQSSSQVVSVAGAATATANFTLTLATGTITGTVKNSSGTAISGAAVSYSGGSTTTDAAGSYALTNVPAGAVSVSASTAGYVAATQNVTVNLNVTATANFTLSAVPPGSIAGTVKNSSGVAINAATVSYAGDSTQTNSSGVYTFSQAPVGTVLLSATAPAYQTSTQSVAVISNVATTANFTLLSTSGEITGVVTNRATAAAIGGATVQISGGTSTTTNAQGAYTFTKVTAGTYTLAASAAGYQQNTNSAVVSSGATSTLNFSLNPLAKIAGTVTDSVTAAGIGNATIQIAGGSSTKTSGSGAYSLNNVSIDNPTIFVTAAVNGYLSVTQSSPVSSGATTTQNFALTQSTATLSGTIMNSAGKPINGAVVSYNGGSTKTKANGTYILKNVPVGTISLSASAGGYQTSTRDVTIAGGVTTTANFNLQ